MIVHSSSPLVLVGGADLGPLDVNILQRYGANTVAVDAGADHLLGCGVVPRAVIGDLDSLSQAARDAFADRLHHVPEQETVDFEKAVLRVAAPVIIAVGFSGGRLDHMLAGLDVMGRHHTRRIILLGMDDIAFVVPDTGITLGHVAKGMRVSLMPLGHADVRATGLMWPVDTAPMAPLGFASPSNAAAGGAVRVTASGPLLMIMPRDMLSAVCDVMLG